MADYDDSTIAAFRASGYPDVESFLSSPQARDRVGVASRSAAADRARSFADRAIAGVNQLSSGKPAPYGGPVSVPQGMEAYRDPNGKIYYATPPPPAPIIENRGIRGGSAGSVSGQSVSRGTVGTTTVGGRGVAVGGNSVVSYGGASGVGQPAYIGGPAPINREELRSINENAQFFASKRGVVTQQDSDFASKFPDSNTAAGIRFNNATGGGGVGHYTYPSGTLGSPTGLDYVGPVDQSGRPASAVSGPWTIRTRGTEEGTGPLVPRGSLAASQGFKTVGDVSASIGKAAFVDAIRGDTKLGQDSSKPNVYSAFGGREPDIKRVLLAAPGETVQFPRQYLGPKSYAEGSTYIPQQGELSKPTFAVKGVDVTPHVLEKVYGNKPEFALKEGTDPRYIASVFENNGQKDLAKTYREFAAQHNIIDKDGKVFYQGPKEVPPPPPPPPPRKKEDEV